MGEKIAGKEGKNRYKQVNPHKSSFTSLLKYYKSISYQSFTGKFPTHEKSLAYNSDIYFL